MGQFFPPGLEEVGRQNRAMVERAMSLFTPFLPQEPKTEPKPEPRPASQSEIDALRAEVESLRRQLAASRTKSES
jgi:polyhydroxyalkanoate synthesis regulator protein